MTLHFWWKPNNAPVKSTSHRVDIGLELGGDDRRNIKGPTVGRVELYEVRGTRARGTAESRQARLVATWHGTFHRRTRCSGNKLIKSNKRITFQIATGRGVTYDPDNHDGDATKGFDPECVLGVDAFAVTFVNRGFDINLPFFVDRRTENAFLEFKAYARTGTGNQMKTLGRSAILHMRIRRSRTVSTTTMMGRNPLTYSGQLIGNLIQQHEDYIVQGLTYLTSVNQPANPVARHLPLPTKGSNRFTFQNYTAGSMRVVLMRDLLGPMIPSLNYFQSGFVGGVTKQQAAHERLHTRVRFQTAVTARLRAILTDAGFAGTHVWWDSDAAAANLVTAFRRSFSRNTFRNRWVLTTANRPMSVPFWTFYAVHGDTGSGIAGLSEGLQCTHIHTQGNRRYELVVPVPIGSGNKLLTKPIEVKTDAYAKRLVGSKKKKRYTSLADFRNIVDAEADRIAILVAHEMAHSLGLMHTVLVPSSGRNYLEIDDVLSIMSTAIDRDGFGRDMIFSNQEKLIWHEAFRVNPTWNTTYLRNKTWGNVTWGGTTWGGTWATVDWSDRRRRFTGFHRMSGMSSNVFVRNPPAYTGKGAKAQKGTYRPATP